MKTYTQWIEQNAPMQAPMPMNATDKASQEEIRLVNRMKAVLPPDLQDLANPKTKGIVMRILMSLSKIDPSEIRVLLGRILKASPEEQAPQQMPQQMPQQS